MIANALSRRLTALERVQDVRPIPRTVSDVADAAQGYARSLAEPGEPDARHRAYLISSSLREIAADTDAMLRGAPAPWLREA